MSSWDLKYSRSTIVPKNKNKNVIDYKVSRLRVLWDNVSSFSLNQQVYEINRKFEQKFEIKIEDKEEHKFWIN